MASGILGLGTSGSTSLNSDLITKLKTAESTAILNPITKQKDSTQKELDAEVAVQTKVTELLDIVKNFDLYTSGTNTFDSVSATTSGTSATFDASDTSKLTPGTINVSVSQLAQKDIYQSDIISDTSATIPGTGSITIKYGKDSSGKDLSSTFTTTGKSYKDLITEMGYNSHFSSSLEQVGDSSYRIVIKSANSGTANALTITQSGIDLGLADKYQSNTISDSTATMIPGNTITVKYGTTNSDTATFNTTGKTYDELITEMQNNSNFSTSLVNGKMIVSDKSGAPLTITENPVYFSQSNTIFDTTASIDSNDTNDSITVKYGTGINDTATFQTKNKTYDDLITEMKSNSNFTTSFVNGKITITGSSNALTITETGVDLGFSGTKTNELGLSKSISHILTAQNMQGTIDGISYDTSSNKITMSTGLSVTANSIGDSSINISRDTSGIASGIENISTKYNELVDLVNSYVTGDGTSTPTVSDSSTLKSMVSSIKNILFGNYGTSNGENIFKYGFSFNKDGHMSVDNVKLSDAVTNNFTNLKELFVGPAEKEGIGTKLKTYLDALDGTNGLLTVYQNKLNNKMTTLGTDYDTASTNLDNKYTQMSDQFAQYTVLITQMQNAFASLKLIIQNNNNSNN